jgi:hypothetical protein
VAADPSFVEAVRTARASGGAVRRHAASERGGAEAGVLLAGSLDELVARLSALTSNLTQWARARRYGRRVGEAHSMRAVVAAYERARTDALGRAGGRGCAAVSSALPAVSGAALHAAGVPQAG